MKSFENLYYKLFSIPRPGVMLTSSLAAALLLSIFHPSVIKLWIAVFLVSLLGTKIVGLKFDLKRISFLAIFVSLISFSSLILGGNIAASSFILFITFYFCSERKLTSFPLSAVPYLIVDVSVETVAILLVSAILLGIYLRVLSARVGKIKIRDFVESFVLFWLTSNEEYMERFLLKHSEEFEGRVRCLTIGDVRLVSTDFHPGPFRNVGGAKLVKRLSRESSVYLHSPTSHARNPASEEDVAKIAAAVECSGEPVKPFRPFTIHGERFDVHCLPFDNLRLIFISGKEHIDDFIIEFDDFVVDCHNAYEPEYDPSSDEIGEIVQLVSMVKKKESSEVERFRYGFVKIDAKSESICEYVAAVLLEYDGERYAIVIFDSNNVGLEFRRHVENLFAEIGYRAIVVSTDNHEKTGVRAKQSYKPAGRCEEDWRIAENLADKCSNVEMIEGKCGYSEGRVRVRVMGEKFLRDAELAAREKALPMIANFLGFAIVNYLLALIC
jgi:putative membrane protein